MNQQSPVPFRVLVAPALLTVVLVAWTLHVYPTSAYGTWHIWPALLVLPAVLLWHGTLIVRFSGMRKPAVLAALFHLAVLAPTWLVCLMRISKDSL